MAITTLNFGSFGFFSILRKGLQMASCPQFVTGRMALLLVESSLVIAPESSLHVNIAQTKGPTSARFPPYTLSLGFLPPCTRASMWLG